MTAALAVGQQLGLAEEFQATEVAMVVDALVVEQKVTVQLVLELELVAALVADVQAAILAVHMIVQEDSTNKKELV